MKEVLYGTISPVSSCCVGFVQFVFIGVIGPIRVWNLITREFFYAVTLSGLCSVLWYGRTYYMLSSWKTRSYGCILDVPYSGTMPWKPTSPSRLESKQTFCRFSLGSRIWGVFFLLWRFYLLQFIFGGWGDTVLRVGW